MHKKILLWNCVYWKKRKCSLEFYFFLEKKKSGGVHLTRKVEAKEPVVSVFLLLGCLFFTACYSTFFFLFRKC